MAAGERVFIFSNTMIKGRSVRAGKIVKVDKADFHTLTKIGRGADFDTAEGKVRIEKWKEENTHLYDGKGKLLSDQEEAAQT
jgi:hypothetical protein